MGFTNRANIKNLIFRTLSKYLVYRISMNIFSEEPFLSPAYLCGQYPPSRKYVWGIISPPRPSLERPNLKKLTSPKRGGRSFSFPLFFIRLRLYVAGGSYRERPYPFPVLSSWKRYESHASLWGHLSALPRGFPDLFTWMKRWRGSEWSDYGANRAGTVGKRSWGGRRKPEGEGGEGEAAWGACA